MGSLGCGLRPIGAYAYAPAGRGKMGGRKWEWGIRNAEVERGREKGKMREWEGGRIGSSQSTKST
jgi:hypothetical protein